MSPRITVFRTTSPFRPAHVYRIGIAEQVVQIAQDLLVRAHQECAEDIRCRR